MFNTRSQEPFSARPYEYGLIYRLQYPRENGRLSITVIIIRYFKQRDLLYQRPKGWNQLGPRSSGDLPRARHFTFENISQNTKRSERPSHVPMAWIQYGGGWGVVDSKYYLCYWPCYSRILISSASFCVVKRQVSGWLQQICFSVSCFHVREGQATRFSRQDTLHSHTIWDVDPFLLLVLGSAKTKGKTTTVCAPCTHPLFFIQAKCWTRISAYTVESQFHLTMKHINVPILYIRGIWASNICSDSRLLERNNIINFIPNKFYSKFYFEVSEYCISVVCRSNLPHTYHLSAYQAIVSLFSARPHWLIDFFFFIPPQWLNLQ